MPGQDLSERRRTARIPAGAKLLHRAVGMSDYALCEVLHVTTSGIELLLDRLLAPGTVVTILVRPDGLPRKFYRVIGTVQRREAKGSRWLHVVRASDKQPWSPIFIYDVMYQALNGSRVRSDMYLDDINGFDQDAEINLPTMITDSNPDTGGSGEPVEQGAAFGNDESVVYSTLAWFAPFDELNELFRQVIARGKSIVRKPAGTTLVERGSWDDVSIYLIDGVLDLEAFDQKKTSIVGGTHDAHHPISLLRPHAYTVKALTDVTVILLSQDIIRKAARITATYRNAPGIEVSEEEAPATISSGS